MRINRRTRDEYLLRSTEFAKRGSELPHSKLTPEQVEEMRSARRQRMALMEHIKANLSNEALARKHGVHVRTVEKVVTGETWCHV